MAQPVVSWWEIASNDAKRLEEFYAELFGWKVEGGGPPGYAVLSSGGEGGIGGGIMQAREEIRPYFTFYVSVDDLQAYLDRAVELGGKTVVPPMPIPNVGTIAMFTDPDGNLVGLHKPQA